jgi:hypothetical protein
MNHFETIEAAIVVVIIAGLIVILGNFILVGILGVL